MGQHTTPRKPEPALIRGLCVVCSTGKQAPMGYGRYRALCRPCYRIRYNEPRKDKRPWAKHKKLHCETCGPNVEYHYCQLDVDHRDGNNKNNDPENYMTLCANCHRLKTFKNKDWL